MEFTRYLTNTKYPSNTFKNSAEAHFKTLVNPMLFWNSDLAKGNAKNHAGFPQVREIALKILSVHVSSVEPESLFSDLKFMVKARQSRMKPSHVNARICLKRWVMAGLIEKSAFEAKLNSKKIKRKVKGAERKVQLRGKQDAK